MAGKGDHRVEEATKLIAEMNISPPTSMAPNREPGRMGNATTVQTNVFGLGVEKSTTVYVVDIRIFADLSPTKQVEFTKKGKDDYLVNDRKLKCVAILEKIIEKNLDVFKDKFSVYYDGQSMLFCLENIFGSGDKFKRFTVAGSDFPNVPELTTLELVVIELKACQTKTSFILSPESIAQQTANLDLEKNDRFLTQFIEIASNQAAIRNPSRHKVFEYGKTYMCNPQQEGLTQHDIKDVGDGKVLMVGSKKSVRQIEGPRGRGTCNASIVLDSMKAAFHVPQKLIEKIGAITNKDMARPLPDGDREKALGVIKGIFVETLHLKNNKRIQVFGFSKQSADESSFEHEGERTNVTQYFQKKYGMCLKYPNAPLVLSKERGQVNCYPAEVLQVVPFQRVTIPQQTPEQSQKSTRECAVAPAVRQRYIMTGCKSLELVNPQNPWMQNAGLRVFPTPIKVAGRMLHSPSISYGGGRSEGVEMGKWRPRNVGYVHPATVSCWAVYLVPDSRSRYSVGDLQNFAKRWYEDACRRGMRMPVPADVRIIPELDIEKTIQQAGVHNCQYILFVVGDLLTNVHKNIKYWERKYEVTTQQIKVTNFHKIMAENKVLTLENCIHKFNVKVGGLNYGLDLTQLNGVARKWFTPERLILGVAITHPPPSAAFSAQSTHPSVVGFAGNYQESPYAIAGDFMFQEARKTDTMASMGEILKYTLERHAHHHKGEKLVKEIILYRTGIDEGGFSMILKEEIPLIRANLLKLGYPDTKVVFVVCQKTSQDVRLFKESINPQDKPTQQNIAPGICVDTQLVHPAYCEFYLNSHTTLQGSAKSAKYTVIYDEIQMTNDEIQGMTYALAHNHQIVNLTTSLPANLYIATRFSERGSAVWVEFNAKEETTSDTSGFDDLNRRLSYRTSKMADTRINA